MPCVIGPHTSMGATLRMTGSRLRAVPDANQALTEVPLRHAPSIVVPAPLAIRTTPTRAGHEGWVRCSTARVPARRRRLTSL